MFHSWTLGSVYVNFNQSDIGVPMTELKKLWLICGINLKFIFNTTFCHFTDDVEIESLIDPLQADVRAKLVSGSLRETIETLDFIIGTWIGSLLHRI